MPPSPKNISAVLIDDEPDSIRILEELLRHESGIEIVGKAVNGNEAVELIRRLAPELVFLDIKMPGRNGFEVIKELKRHGIHTSIIFVTAFDEYAIEAIRNAAFDFLVKPVNPDELRQAVDRFRTEQPGHDLYQKIDQLLLTLEKNKKLRFNTRTGFVLLNSSDIVYCESDRNYSIIYYGDQKKEVVTCNLGTLEDLLPALVFRRISRFTIINTDYLVKVDRKKRHCVLSRNGIIYELGVNRENFRELGEIEV